MDFDSISEVVRRRFDDMVEAVQEADNDQKVFAALKRILEPEGFTDAAHIQAVAYLFSRELKKRIDAALDNTDVDVSRGGWGDKNPCRICGKYGHEMIWGSWISLCKNHWEWYTAEYYKFHPKE